MTLLELIETDLKNQANDLMQLLVKGNVDSFDKYKSLVGHYRGLMASLETISEHRSKFEDEDG